MYTYSGSLISALQTTEVKTLELQEISIVMDSAQPVGLSAAGHHFMNHSILAKFEYDQPGSTCRHKPACTKWWQNSCHNLSIVSK
jgi:hypothetical protein